MDRQFAAPMKFVADAMLGRLARWLRFLGFDVLYFRDIDDRELVRIARAEGRILLTRDRALAGRRGLLAPVLITSDDVHEQLRQMTRRLDFSAAAALGRCDLCNGLLVAVEGKEQVREQVPDFIYRSFATFVRCSSCGKVYWPGTHYRLFRRQVEGILGAARES